MINGVLSIAAVIFFSRLSIMQALRLTRRMFR